MACSKAVHKLSDKVAIVTASTAGIGYEIAKRLAVHGAKVVVSSREKDHVNEAVRKLRSQQLDVSGVVCHVGKENDRKNLIQAAIDTYGKLDTVVLNAGINPYVGPFLDTPESHWDRIFEINVKCGFLLATEVLPHLKQTKGSMLFVSSATASNPAPVVGAYAVSKAAVLALMKVLALQCAQHNVRVNAIAPSCIDTNFAQVVTQSKYGDEILKLTALKRYGDATECAGPAVFLCSDDASYVTGETLFITGGLSLSNVLL